MKLLLVLFAAVALTAGFKLPETTIRFNVGDEQWHTWKSFHGKKYSTETEEQARFAIWVDNMQKILKHNSGNHKYKLAMNHFGDLTFDEYSYQFLGMRAHYSNHTKRSGSTFLAASNVKLPEEVDWRKEGYVTEVKNQGRCGSCWSFSTTGSLEGQHFKKTGNLVSLSEQNLVDCSASYGNNGCHGGLMDNAFNYIKDNGGIDTERSYPYEGMDDQCRYNSGSRGATCSGHVDIQQFDESDLQSATATVGPISVAIDAGHQSFQFYHEGVYDNPECSSTQLDHGVLVVGYGTYEGQDYWLVKNSWGPQWGLEGYVRMARNKDNQCGIATAASYPLV